MFCAMDKNGDGFVDLEEIKAWWTKQDSSQSAMKAMEDLWGMDTDHDGKVSKLEWLNFMGGKVTDEQYKENIEIGKSALTLKNLVSFIKLKSWHNFSGHGALSSGSPAQTWSCFWQVEMQCVQGELVQCPPLNTGCRKGDFLGVPLAMAEKHFLAFLGGS